MNVTSSSTDYNSIYDSIFSDSSSSTSSLSTKFAEDLLSYMDSDSSGTIDSTEFSDAALALSTSSDTASIDDAFSALDTNQDGVISADELAGSLESLLSMQGKAGMESMPPPPPPPSDSIQDTGYTQDELSSMATTTGDSKASSLFSALAANFDAADTNSDGKVSSEEARAYQQSIKEASVGGDDSQDNIDFMQELLASIIAQYSTDNSTASSTLNLSA